MQATEQGHLTAGAALAAAAARFGAAEALCFPDSGGSLSFADWDAAATALARACRGLGLGPGERIALLAENRLEWPVVQIAVARLGAVLVPLNTHLRAEDLGQALRLSGARALFLSPVFRRHRYLEAVRACRAELPGLEFVIALDAAGPDCLDYRGLCAAGAESAAELPNVTPGDAAALLFTSGTTGRPKGAVLSHRAMLMNAAATARRLEVRPGERWTSIIPLFHCAGCIMNLLGCLQFGACYVGLPAYEPEAMFRIIESQRCGLLSGVPTTYLGMLRHPARESYDLSSLRAGTCGGADADPEVLAACARDFPMPGLVQVYGQTESGTLITCPEHRDPARWETAGPPLEGYELRITDPATGAALPPGRTGQIEARGAMTMEGYHGEPGTTAETLDAEGWLKTGDLGYLRPDGRLVVAGGRLRDMIIRGGENIYPAEIEAVLARHPAVEEAAVFGLPDRYYGEIVAAALRLQTDARAEILARHCADAIAGFKVPVHFFRVAEFPLTASGKIKKRVLRERAAGGELEVLP